MNIECLFAAHLYGLPPSLLRQMPWLRTTWEYNMEPVNLPDEVMLPIVRDAWNKIADGTKTSDEVKTLHHLEPGEMFRDQHALWLVCDGGDSDNIRAMRIANPCVNGTGSLRFSRDYATVKMRVENYNAYNQVRLIDGIYHVVR